MIGLRFHHLLYIESIRKGEKMIKTSKQNWNIGQVVKVGFMTLRITGIRAIKDYMPDIYDLESLDGKITYEFIPHNGLHKV